MRYVIAGLAVSGCLLVSIGVALRFGVPESLIVAGALMIGLAFKAAGVVNAADD